MSKKLKTTTSYIIIGIIFAVVIAGAAIYYAYQEGRKYVTASENGYNMAFFELVDYVQNVETYLAKALISTTPEHGAETLTNVWREASVAQSCLAQLPINSNELENTSKFLNQVSDYSYSLSRKAIGGENLSQEDLNNIKQLHTYSLDLENTLNQLSTDLNSGRIKWNELRDEGTRAFATQVSSITKDSFSNLEENFHEYAGLIYDGAFSEHISSSEKKGLTGEDIDEEKAKEIVNQFYGADKIDNIESHGYSENAEIPSFDFNVKMKEQSHIFDKDASWGRISTQEELDIWLERIQEFYLSEHNKYDRDFFLGYVIHLYVDVCSSHNIFLPFYNGLKNDEKLFAIKNQQFKKESYYYLYQDYAKYHDLKKILSVGNVFSIENVFDKDVFNDRIDQLFSFEFLERDLSHIDKNEIITLENTYKLIDDASEFIKKVFVERYI